MSAPVLTISEQKAAISGKKKKKRKTVKNVLGIPDSLKVECHPVEANKVVKLHELLNRLLPSARLQVQQNDNSDKDSAENYMREAAKNKRNQLSLGVNAVNKGIKKNLIAAVLLANDIQPKFLINHLNLLCNHNKVPVLHIPSLRETTKTNLGFPCIALGFKTHSCHFVEVVKEIKSIFEIKKTALENENQETEVDSSESDAVDEGNDKANVETDVGPFVYLYRSSVKERAFVPGKDSNSVVKKRTEGEFISIKKCSSETINKKCSSQLGISSNMVRKQQARAKKFQDFLRESYSDEELEVPKEKKEWVINKVGNKQNFKYSPAKLLKIPSNPNRNLKK